MNVGTSPRRGGVPQSVQALRYWDYYGMTNTFTDLYDRATRKESFNRLYDIITSRENILLSY